MASMDSYPKAAMERAMKVQDVMLQAMAKKITWWQAAVEKPRAGKVIKPTFPARLEIPHNPRDSHFPTAPTAAG
jgi:hypothetical protein